MQKFLIVIQPEAEQDILAAFSWYKSQVYGLGQEYIDALDDTFEKIAKNPELYGRVFKDVRRALIKKFPFGVFYLIDGEKIIILAVFHAKRNPVLLKRRK